MNFTQEAQRKLKAYRFDRADEPRHGHFLRVISDLEPAHRSIDLYLVHAFEHAELETAERIFVEIGAELDLRKAGDIWDGACHRGGGNFVPCVIGKDEVVLSKNFK